MSRHSRHNTSLAYFTNHERSELSYGTKKRKLGEDSFRPFDACNLCHTQASDPVSCPHGDLFCRQCALENLLAQKAEISALKRELQREEQIKRHNAAAHDDRASLRQLEDFERVQAGMQSSIKHSTKPIVKSDRLLIEGPVKRASDVDVETLQRNADAKDQYRDDEKDKKGAGSAFWLAEEVPDNHDSELKLSKTHPICPAGDHPLALKTLVPVSFEIDHDKNICPACKKQLTNVLGGQLFINCGHVVCKICMQRFVKDDGRCPKCSRAFISAAAEDKKRHATGLIELRQEGTGYASKRDAVIEKKGIAFQG